MVARATPGYGTAQRPPLAGTGTRLDDPRTRRLQLYTAAPPAPAGRSSPPLLLIHSVNAAASAYEMRPLYEHLADSRPTYALDLPGYGLSDRSARPYTPRLMTDAIQIAVAHVRRLHDGVAIDAIALSLSCEFLARAVTEKPRSFRSIALVSPTGLSGTRRRDGPPGSTLGRPVMRAILTGRWWSRGLFRLLTRPSVVRYFLRRTFGRRDIDEGLWAYAVETAAPPGAEHAPLDFLSGCLFSADITRVYEELELPVWMCHGVRGDFVDYKGAAPLLERERWTGEVFETGALPHFEVPEAVEAAYHEFIERVAAVG